LARDGAADDETGIAHALEMYAHAVGMEAEPLGQLAGGGGATELGEEREQASPGRLDEHVVTGAVREVNSSQLFSHVVGRNRPFMLRCRRSLGESRSPMTSPNLRTEL
jgi:hypothetical protein